MEGRVFEDIISMTTPFRCDTCDEDGTSVQVKTINTMKGTVKRRHLCMKCYEKEYERGFESDRCGSN